MRVKKAILVVALVGSSLFLTAPAGHAQYCEADDYSASCKAQRQCERNREKLGRLGDILISCTQ